MFLAVGRELLNTPRIPWVVLAVAVGTAATLTLMVCMPSLTECLTEIPVRNNQHWFQPAKVVVEPWRGPHHVYGVFVIPRQYKFDHLYTSKLTIQGYSAQFQAGSPEDEDIHSGQAEPGYYVKRVYLSTRTAIWFLLMWRFGDLRTSCHWWLVIGDKVR